MVMVYILLYVSLNEWCDEYEYEYEVVRFVLARSYYYNTL